MKVFNFREHQPQLVPVEIIPNVLEAVGRVSAILRPTLNQFKIIGREVEFKNIVGSIGLANGDRLVVEPKVESRSNWADSVIQLLEHETRISVSGSRRSGDSQIRNDLSEAVGYEYARRLRLALRKDGPIQIYRRKEFESTRISGQLLVGKWMRKAFAHPFTFPQVKDELSAVNPFTYGLSMVARILSRTVANKHVSAELRELATLAAPGQSASFAIDRSIVSLRLPSQWSAYQPAWDIAKVVLENRSLISESGRNFGLDIAVEPWPLLETLLTRCLEALAQISDGEFEVHSKAKHPLLADSQNVVTNVIPDGLIFFRGAPFATFEAKYTKMGKLPKEAHVYQALATAAALNSPIAFLVYPTECSVRTLQVTGFAGRPVKLVLLGLGMYSYERSQGDLDRARQILSILSSLRGYGVEN
ncbi:5-methylcytosine restriction system specificity protein McrC [Glutamicibacter sp.]|uniref:5-methylcytosine restriction system specificity protein McrC n=1 Tax=Glutamicibacter sp. TaxID=1931995 RepID=UPI003D6A48FB